MLIVKLPNDYFIGGFSEGGFEPKAVSDKDGLLFSITNRLVFPLLNANSRAIANDEYFLVFGAAEIRIKTHENKIFSNFGINQAAYNSGGHSVVDFLGTKSR